jgi:hypothetical protein
MKHFGDRGMRQVAVISFLITVALLGIRVVGSGAQDAPNRPQATLQETTSWLESHLMNLHSTFELTAVTSDATKKPPKEIDRDNTHFSEAVSAVHFERCLLFITTTYEDELGTVTTSSKVPLDRMITASSHQIPNAPKDEENTKYTALPAMSYSLEISSALQVVSWHRTTEHRGRGAGLKDGTDSSLTVKLDDSELAPRLVNGLNHAIELCHSNGNTEPF